MPSAITSTGGGTTLTDSASLRTALSDENGTGVALFDSATSPTFVTPILGTPTSGNASNLTALNATQLTSGTVPLARLSEITTSQTTGIAASGANTDITSLVLSSANSAIIGFAGNTTTGIGQAQSGDVTYYSSGTRRFGFNVNNLKANSASIFTFSSSTDPYGAGDIGFARNAAGVMEINNGTAGAFSGLKAAASTWSGNMTFATDNTYDIGASGATRPRTGYFGTSLSVPLVTTTKSGENIRMVGSDAYISFYNTGNTTRTGYIQGDTTIGLGLFTNISVPITVNVGNTLACTFDTSQNVVVANQLKLNKTYTAAGTTGAQTINKQSGTVRFAIAATTLVVTNSTVATTSKILLSPQTKDATAIGFWPTAASGSFTITANAAATAETEVYFEVKN